MEAKIHKPVLIVIAGPNGSGKTTITSRVFAAPQKVDTERWKTDGK